tara:strand:+ start:378 stop:566 length:189 start_codon:yes stop_codon:yes gene_type:complete
LVFCAVVRGRFSSLDSIFAESAFVVPGNETCRIMGSGYRETAPEICRFAIWLDRQNAIVLPS